MPDFILDTDTFSLFRQNHPAVVRNVLGRKRAAQAVTAITIEESLAGWYTLLRQAKQPSQLVFAYGRLTATVTALAAFPLLTFDPAAATRFEQLRQLKLRIGTQDMRIAAIALEYNATVVTRNTGHFGRVPGLTITDWSV
jgi:tRNA(fMet)-specific endonuclease VapC